MIYLDAGILVKLYVDEPDSQDWRDRLSPHQEFITSALSMVEFHSALRQRVAAGLLRKKVAADVLVVFRKRVDAGAMRFVGIGTDVLLECHAMFDQLSIKVHLRSLDAIHLATARLNQPCSLATTDRQMTAAANELKIPLF